MQDGGGTKVEQAERAEQERTEPVEPERRPTYKTLDEQQGRLTEAEERFERGRRTIGLCLCVILNVASADDVFGSVFDSTILLFIGSFIIAEAMVSYPRPTASRLTRGRCYRGASSGTAPKR
jgi:hypothetical protein